LIFYCKSQEQKAQKDNHGSLYALDFPHSKSPLFLMFGNVIVMNGRFSQVVIAIVDRDLLPFFRRAGVIHILQVATIERITANAGDAITESDRGQLGAPSERIIANGDDAITESDGGQLGAISERRIANGGNAVGDSETCIGLANGVLHQSFAVFRVEIAVNRAIVLVACCHSNIGQLGAMQERITTNSGDTATESDRGQAIAIIERRIANAGDTVGDNDRGQI